MTPSQRDTDLAAEPESVAIELPRYGCRDLFERRQDLYFKMTDPTKKVLDELKAIVRRNDFGSLLSWLDIGVIVGSLNRCPAVYGDDARAIVAAYFGFSDIKFCHACAIATRFPREEMIELQQTMPPHVTFDYFLVMAWTNRQHHHRLLEFVRRYHLVSAYQLGRFLEAQGFGVCWPYRSRRKPLRPENITIDAKGNVHGLDKKALRRLRPIPDLRALENPPRRFPEFLPQQERLYSALPAELQAAADRIADVMRCTYFGSTLSWVDVGTVVRESADAASANDVPRVLAGVLGFDPNVFTDAAMMASAFDRPTFEKLVKTLPVHVGIEHYLALSRAHPRYRLPLTDLLATHELNAAQLRKYIRDVGLADPANATEQSRSRMVQQVPAGTIGGDE